MMENLPAGIDKTEGGFAWDLTYPTALEKSELMQFHFVRILQILFPMWADGIWLDRHARDCGGMVRRPANPAYGHVTVTGIPGTVIPQGFRFAVPSDGGEPAILYYTLKEAEIGEDGTVSLAINAEVAGPGSNVGADTVTIMAQPIKGITGVTNPEAITGGAEAESDDSLRQRIDDYNAGRGKSFVGNNYDYKRWAEEVPGVGHAHTIPEYMGPNSVKVVVVDAQGLPANEQILANVDKHIFGTDRKDMERLAPIGVINHLVAAPEPHKISYSFHLKLKKGYTQEDVVKGYRDGLFKYYSELATTSSSTMPPVLFIRVADTLTHVIGVADFKLFRMNGGLENVDLLEDEYPVTEGIEVTLYE